MSMQTFEKWLEEKANKVVSGGWTVLKLDDETDLMTNMKLISKGEVQISVKGGKVENVKLKRNKPFIDQIEKIIGSKLDMKCQKTLEFIELYPCECDV